MSTDLSLSSLGQVLALVNETNGISVTAEQVTLNPPVILVDDPSTKDTQVTVVATPNGGYNGSVDIKYNRLDLEGFLTYGPAEVVIPVDGTVADVVNGFNELYSANVSLDDIELELGDIDYEGKVVTFAATNTSFAFNGEIDVTVKWPSVILDSVITIAGLDGLEFPIVPIDQFITFTQPGAVDFGETFTIEAVSTSELPVSFSSVTPAVCTVTEQGDVTLLSIGTCSIQGDQEGNEYYLSATPVICSFTVNAVVPNPPTDVSGVGGNKSATLAFTPPAFTGGSPIIDYTATSNPGNVTASGPSSPLVVSGLADSTAYTFTVTARNVVGVSVPSIASATITTYLAIPKSYSWEHLDSVAHTGVGIDGVSVDSDGGNTWLSSFLLNRVQRSTDNGATWTALTAGLNSGGVTVVNKFASDKAGVWVAVLAAGWAARSTDNGATWSALPRTLNSGSGTNDLTSVATDGAGVWVAVANGGFAARSTDNGVTWTALTQGLSSGLLTAAWKSVATNGSGVWMAVSNTGYVSRSTDNGLTWSAVTRGLNSGLVGAVWRAIDTDGNGVWIAVANAGWCSRSVDNGVTWTALPQGLASGNLTGALAQVASNRDGVWIVTPGTASTMASFSLDSGATWKQLGIGMNTRSTAAIGALGVNDNDTWMVFSSSGNGSWGKPLTGDRGPLFMGGYSVANTLPASSFTPCAEIVDDILYIIGGSTSEGASGSGTVRRYNTLTNTWLANGTGLENFIRNSVSVVHNGKIHVFGGGSSNNASSTYHYRYDPVANTWTTMAALPFATNRAGAIVVDNYIYVHGGRNGTSTVNYNLSRYDTTNNTWTNLTAAPVGGGNYIYGMQHKDGKLYVITCAATPVLTVYDIALGTWSTVTLTIPYIAGTAVYPSYTTINGILYMAAASYIYWFDIDTTTFRAFSSFNFGTGGALVSSSTEMYFLGGDGQATNLLKFVA